MKLIIGLGNPGEKYRNNRHNVGYMLVDKIDQYQKLKSKNQKYKEKIKNFLAKKTGAYMNESGELVKKLVEQYRVSLPNLWIIHDDLDIPLGSYKIQKGKGPKEHKGLISIDNALGSSDYWHVRIGVDNRKRDNRISGKEYVLQDFRQEEKTKIDKVAKEICKKLATL